jgi:plasmid stabilization system protein ParE
MPRGDKSKYTDKQKREAEHIEEGYEGRGLNEREAARRAWATVNKMTGGENGTAGRAKASRLTSLLQKKVDESVAAPPPPALPRSARLQPARLQKPASGMRPRRRSGKKVSMSKNERR